jgi:predicted negative regulator of RcsB-dependent stress response
MTTSTTAKSDLAEAERRLAQLKARQERLDARLAYLQSVRARKDDTRRKILAGAILLAKVESGDFELRTLKRWLDKALTRKDDRSLFGL